MAGSRTTSLTFLHTGDPTGLKFSVEHGDARAIFDFGREHAPGRAAFSMGLSPRRGRELADLLAMGVAPRLEGVYQGQEYDGRTQVFITHLHLDHTALVQYLHPLVPLHYPAGMEPVRRDAAACGYLPWREPRGRPHTDGEEVLVGDISVRFAAVDHDVPGATGYLVRTPDLTIAFTGDLRRHGLHPERTEAFAAGAKGCDLLIQECVSLASLLAPVDGNLVAPAPLTEAEAAEEIERAVTTCRGLVVTNLYGMNRERVRALAAACRRSGRRLLMDRTSAGLAGWVDLLTPTSAGMAAASPREFCVQLDFDALPELIDLRPPPGSRYIHSGGSPLGAYDPAWNVLQGWLRSFDLELVVVACSGHSRPADLEWLAAEVWPKVVAPVHTRAPELLLAPGIPKLIPETGRSYSAGEIFSLSTTARS